LTSRPTDDYTEMRINRFNLGSDPMRSSFASSQAQILA